MALVQKINVVKKKLKWSAKDVLFNMGLRSHSKKEKCFRILALHGVVANARKDINARFISTDELEDMVLLFKQNYKLISLNEVSENVLENTLNLALTFDDGYANNYEHVLPILRKHGVPATFFITTPQVRNAQLLWPDMLDLYRKSGKANIEVDKVFYHLKKDKFVSDDGMPLKTYMTTGDRTKAISQIQGQWNKTSGSYKNETSEYWRLMDESMIKEIANDPLFSVGTHGVTHLSLPNITLKNATEELLESKKYLEKLISKEVTDLAYPFGHYNLDLINAAKNIGYKKQLLVDFNDDADECLNGVFPRMANNPFMSINNQVEVFANGHY